MEAGSQGSPATRSQRIVTPAFVVCALVLVVICCYMLVRASTLQGAERSVDVELKHARVNDREFSSNLRYEHQSYAQLAHDFARVLRVQAQRRSIMNNEVVDDYRNENMPAYQHLYDLYNVEIAANRDILRQIEHLRKAYIAFTDQSSSVLGYAATAHYQAAANSYLADLSLATADANAADSDIRLVLSDMINWRPLYVGDYRIAENIRNTARANEIYAQALSERAELVSEQRIIENNYMGRVQHLANRSRVLHGTFL